MKKELLATLEDLLKAEDPLKVQKEFKQASAQLKNLIESSRAAAAAQQEGKKAQAEEGDDTDGSKKAESEKAVNTAQESAENPSKEQPSTDLDLKPADAIPAAENVENVEQVEAKQAPEDRPSELQAATEQKSSSPDDVKEDAQAVNAESQPNTNSESTSEAKEAHLEVDANPDIAQEEVKQGAMPAAGQTKDEAQEPGANTDGNPEAEEKSSKVPEGSQLAEASEDVETPKDEFEEIALRLKEINKAFKSRIAKAREEVERIEKETVQTAKDLLSELRTLVENEENIGKAFAAFNAIQEKWKSLPKVSNDNYRDLNSDYNKEVERFFYNINIYKELKELDLKRNLEEKQQVLSDQIKLLEVKDIRQLELEVRLNQDRWNEIGPTFKEEWEKIKDEFWSTTKEIYRRIHEFYGQRREEQERNLEAKRELLEAGKRILALDLKAHKKWQERTREMIELQKKWKQIGFVPKEQASKLWKEFRETCDAFFEKKRVHYNEIKEEQDKNRDLKSKLLEEAEALKESTDWKETSARYIDLQKQWKKIGAAHQRDENRLWKKFRAACDHFFEARNAQKSVDSAAEKENLRQKLALIEELRAFTPSQAKKDDLAKLKEFSQQWRGIGHVPFREKDKINKAYRSLMDEKFAALKIDNSVKEKMRFEEKIDLLKSSDAKGKLVQKEMDSIRHRISKIESEINQYENNLGFFNNSKGAEKLKAEVMKKIDQAKERVDQLYEQIDQLSDVE